MGIPGLYAYLKKSHPHAIIRNHDSVFCDHLFLDFNFIVHGVISEVNSDSTASVERSVDAVCDALVRIVEYYRPVQSVMIAMDGVPVVAKMKQQRARRYATASERRRTVAVDSNWVSPGTQYMAALERRIEEKALPELAALVHDVIWSSTDEPGEGEQKIFRHLEHHHARYKSDIIFIAGLDADLILYALLMCGRHNFWSVFIVRWYDNNYYEPERVHIPRLLSAIRVPLRDFVTMCFFLGTDFAPRLPVRESVPEMMVSMVSAASSMGASSSMQDWLRNLTPIAMNVIQKREYYHDNFYPGAQDCVDQICAEYMEAVRWCADYFQLRDSDAFWYYRHWAPPLMTDLRNYIMVAASPPLPARATVEAAALSKLEHMLMILPRAVLEQHADLYPEIPRVLSRISWYFPDKWQKLPVMSARFLRLQLNEITMGT